MKKPRITPHDAQAALDAWTRYKSYDAAAQSLGITFGTFQRRLGKARAWAFGPTPFEKPRIRITADFSAVPEPRPEPLYSDPAPTSLPQAETIRVLAIGDTHDDPYLPKDRFRWIGKHAAGSAPDRIVQIGDICDLESLSFHSPNDTDSGRFKPRFLADMESLDRALDQLMEPISAANLDIRVDVTLGNHEHRIWRFEDTAPEVSGMLQADFASHLHRYGIHFHRYGQFMHIGGVGFVHAPFSVMGRPIGGMTGSQTVARQTMHDVVSGHSHKTAVITAPKVGDDNRVTVIDLGCALPWGHVQSYAKHTTTGWWWGIYELTIKAGRIQAWNAIPMFTLAERYG